MKPIIHTANLWRQILPITQQCRTFCLEWLVFQDKWYVMAVVSQGRFHCNCFPYLLSPVNQDQGYICHVDLGADFLKAARRSVAAINLHNPCLSNKNKHKYEHIMKELKFNRKIISMVKPTYTHAHLLSAFTFNIFNSNTCTCTC